MKQVRVVYTNNRGVKACGSCGLDIQSMSPKGTIRTEGTNIHYHPKCLLDMVVTGFIQERHEKVRKYSLSKEDYATRQKIMNRISSVKSRIIKSEDAEKIFTMAIYIKRMEELLNNYGGRAQPKPKASELLPDNV